MPGNTDENGPEFFCRPGTIMLGTRYTFHTLHFFQSPIIGGKWARHAPPKKITKPLSHVERPSVPHNSVFVHVFVSACCAIAPVPLYLCIFCAITAFSCFFAPQTQPYLHRTFFPNIFVCCARAVFAFSWCASLGNSSGAPLGRGRLRYFWLPNVGVRPTIPCAQKILKKYLLL